MHSKTLFLGLILVTGQAHASFMFCESKLKKIGLTKEEAKSACASPFIDSTKKMLETEDPKKMAKVIRLMNSSVSYDMDYYTSKLNTRYGILDPNIALKVANRLPDDALENFNLLVERFGITEAAKMAELLPPEKMKYANKISKVYGENQTSFYNVINTATTDQLAAYILLLDKFSSKDAASLIPKYSKKDIECGLSFTSSNNEKYENYMSLCNQYNTAKLCGPKTLLFKTALKARTSNSGAWLMDQLIKSDHYTKNHALLVDKIYSSGFDSTMLKTTEKLLKNNIVSDQLTKQVLKEFENPFVTSKVIEDLINPALPDTTIIGRTFERSGSVAANWGNGSFSACSSSNGQMAIAMAIQEAESECEEYYKSKNDLRCATKTDKNKSQGICKFTVTTVSSFDKDKTSAKSCYDQDLQDGLSAVNKINHTEKDNKDSFVNETRLLKEAETVSGPNSEIKAKKTSDK